MFNSTSIQQLPVAFATVDVPVIYETTYNLVLRAFMGFLQLSTLWKALVIIFLWQNSKVIPLVYHLRLVNAFRFILHSLKPEQPISPEQLFQPLITSSQVQLMEIDLNLHKSNSTYFTDFDIARGHLLCTLFARGIEKIRGGTSSFVRGKVSDFGIALGGVSCSFHRELKPYEKYDIYTRVLSWDHKWLYLTTHFVKKGAAAPSMHTLYPQQKPFKRSNNPTLTQDPKKAIVASALSKLVFKKGRITVAPEVVLEAAGLLPERTTSTQFSMEADMIISPPDAHSLPSPSTRTNSVDSRANSEDNHSLPDSMTTIEEFDDELLLDSAAKGTKKTPWTWQHMERQRRRGMEMAKLLADQINLADHFNADGEALGYHTDGTGAQGVISSLAQLGQLTRKSSL